MIVIIQCAAKKRSDAGFLRTKDGTPVLFVADPAKAPPSDEYIYARPDEPSDRGMSWREALVRYNEGSGSNPLGLLRAYELYANPIYRRLVDRFGVESTYILSAGWGLIGARFLTPYYDITFSPSARKEPHKRRRSADRFEDLCMLPPHAAEPVVFFGGKDYVPLFCRLTERAKGARVLFYGSGTPPAAPGCLPEKFPTTTRTNWHYECATAFLDGKIALSTAVRQALEGGTIKMG